MKYIFNYLKAIIISLWYTFIYISYFIYRLLWDFKIVKYSDVISNHGVTDADMGYYTISNYLTDLKCHKNPIDTFKRVLKDDYL